MAVALVSVSLVAICALLVCAVAINSLMQMHAATVRLLSDQLGSRDTDLSRLHGSLGMALTDAASRTASAIGDAVQKATFAPAPTGTPRDLARDVARDAVNTSDYDTSEPDDLDIDPTDWSISPEREDLAVVHRGDRNPTGVPGFAFDLPHMPDDISIPTPIHTSNGA